MADLTQTVQLDPAELTTDQLLDYACQIKAASKQLNSSLDAIQDELTARVEAGDLDPTFSHNDWGFTWSAGRRSWSYPEPVQALEAGLKAAKKAAEADGTATASTGAPYWTIREPKP